MKRASKPMRTVLLITFVGVSSLIAPAWTQAPSLPQPDSVFLEELTWIEARDAIAAGKTTIIIPTGGTEQNGPHIVLGKHNYLVKYKAGEIAKSLGNALVAPVVAYVPEGDINPPTGHMRFAGTITLPQDVFSKVLEYAARSFKQHGFLDIALVGDSGGNQAGQKIVADALNREWAATKVRVHHVTAYYPGRGDDWVEAQGVSTEDVGSHDGQSGARDRRRQRHETKQGGDIPQPGNRERDGADDHRRPEQDTTGSAA